MPELPALVGTWTLDRFEVSDAESPPHPWGFDTTGLLIYAPSGHMSVAINRFAPWRAGGRPSEPGQGTSRVLFYAGTYHVEGGMVYHHVTQASDLTRVGAVMARRARLAGDILTLVSEGGPVRATLEWRRVSPSTSVR